MQAQNHAEERKQLQTTRDSLITKIAALKKQIPTEIPETLNTQLAAYTHQIEALLQSAERPWLNRMFGKAPRDLLAAEVQALQLTLEKNQLIQAYFLEKELLTLNTQFLDYFKKIHNFNTLPDMIKEDLIRIQGARLIAMQHLHISKTLNDLLPHLPALLLCRNQLKNGLTYLESALKLEDLNTQLAIAVPPPKPFNLFSFLWDKLAYGITYTLFLIRYLWQPTIQKALPTAPPQRPPTPLDASRVSTYASCPSPHTSPQPLSSPNV